MYSPHKYVTFNTDKVMISQQLTQNPCLSTLKSLHHITPHTVTRQYSPITPPQYQLTKWKYPTRL